MKKSLDEILYILREASPYPVKTEYRFHPVRHWRFDYCIPEVRLAIEIEGAVYTRGRHTRGKGYIGDMEKYNTAQLMGWTVLRYTYGQEEQMYKDIQEFTRKKVS